ncbi:phage replisome organizer N-terminal domain-containing protein [Sporosarcina sp. FSL K6-1540]|uniref:phage replisome organizer N-terminal domain-containing protein n=1 Tax=Sporosarcina sp. FSL K6-1540 TaxID=2921555 RepID=UPI003159DBA7
MSNVKWIKLSTQMFEDEKIKLIEHMPDADTILIIWVKLLSQAGKANANGYIYLSENIPYTDEMLATIFGRPLNTVRMALGIFKQFGMIDIDDNHFINIENWEKHQNVAGLDKIREQSRKRVAKHRENKRLGVGNANVTLPVTQSNATELELDIELEREKESNKGDVANAPVVSDDLFEEWWNLYAHKVGDKKKCRTKYKSLLKKNKHEEIISGSIRYKNHLEALRASGEFAPNPKYPYTFLNGENFNDEYEVGGASSGGNSRRNEPVKQYADGINF